MRLKPSLISLTKWLWFAVLLLVAFGYMSSGLSQPRDVPNRSATPAEPTRLNGRQPSPAQSNDADFRAVNASPSAADGSPSPRREDSIAEVVARVDQARRETLRARGVPSAEPADWLTICRRTSLALVGSGLSLEEIRRLEAIPESQRIDAHLNALLIDPRFHHYWGERMTRYLVGADEGPFIVYRRRRFRHWLADQLAANRPYDQIVRDLITAEGLWTDRPEVNFLTVTFDSNDGNPDPIRLAARTSRAFLGLRIDCLQCHSDFLGNVSLGDPGQLREGRQSDFHQLAAFYSSATTNGLQGIRTGEVEYRYQYLYDDEETEVEPAVPFAEDLLPEQGDTRTRLAAWVTHRDNRQFDRAAIARVWALMFGRAATDAVDDLPLDQPLPPPLVPLVDDFAGHRDLRRAIRIIVGSEAFRVDSRASFDITGEHERVYAVFPLTRLRGEQVAGSIVQASKIKSIDRESSFLVQLIRFGSINDFLKRYGDLGENEFSKDGITIPQRLMMLNGEMLREAADANPVLGATAHINLFARDDEQAVDTIFLCLLNRYPGEAERDHFVQRLSDSDDRSAAMEDFFWTLANTTEFAWNH
jgi:hypothetical protein